MTLALDETQRLVVDALEKLLSAEWDEPARRAALATPERSSPDLWRQIAELGLTGIGISEEYGGTGGTFADLAGILEVFGARLVLEPFVPSTVVVGFLLDRAGTEAQRRDLLPGVAEGRLRLAFAHGEPDTRHATEEVATRAVRRGDPYILSGRKVVVPGANLADHVIVSARTSGDTFDRDGVSLFLVPADAAGLRRRPYPMLGGGGAADLFLEDVELPASALVGAEGAAHDLVAHALDRAIVAQCCLAIGQMETLAAMTLDYIKQRKQFGQPIGKFQVLQHRMVDMTMDLQLARAMTNFAVAQVDSDDGKARGAAVSAAKARVILSAQSVGRGAIQLHGGIGMTMEYEAGRYFRALTEMEHLFGDLDTHVERFALSA